MSARSGLSFGKVITALVLVALATSAAWGQSFFQSDATAATAITVQGSVSLARDTGMWAVNSGDTVRAQQVIVTGPDGYAAFKVADGSTFEVFPNSRVTFRSNPGNWRDMVDACLSVLDPQGILFFSSNARTLRLDPDSIPMARVEDISARTVPEDYRGHPHRSWLVRPISQTISGQHDQGGTSSSGA